MQIYNAASSTTLAILYDLVAKEPSRRKQSELISKGRELRKLSNDVSREKCNPRAHDGFEDVRSLAVDLGVW